ncbi:MAG TPA: helix-turn-helix transcriptional regulator [Cytophagaceae bacterium]|jgi:transcriptional regulator with XRE-family HTH domain|nr:helix-turn-helix transcriptional regulator [Cytophagaceae bacterium]
MADLKSIGQRVEEIKKNFNYSNGQLGEVCGVSYTAIAKIISGATKDPSVSIFINLTEKLKVNINWLLFNEGQMFSDHNQNAGMRSQSNQEKEITKILLHSKEEENEMLKKIVKLLEDWLSEIQSRKKAS